MRGMATFVVAAILLPVLVRAAPAPARAALEPANPSIDMPAYLRLADEAARHREARRISEERFGRWSREPGTVVLDARSAEKYALLHVRGALHLDFSDITVESLARLIPDRTTRILIYCNNNFSGAEEPFPSKLPAASLNLSTFIALYTYGYKNVWELGPLVELERSRLAFDGTGAAGR